GYPDTALGTAVSGGSAANLTGLLAARARRPDRRVIVCGEDTHYSVARAAAIMGISEVVKVPTNDEHRMDVDALAALLEEVRPTAIVATAGSTATGSFDDLRAIAALRDRHDTWLHVDAAHGASVLLSPSLQHLVEGLDVASDEFEAMHVPEFNIFCFRHRSHDETNARLREDVIRSGEAWITSTVLKGQRVLRVTMINPRTEREHVDAMLDAVRRAAR